MDVRGKMRIIDMAPAASEGGLMMARLIDADSILDDFLKRYTEMERDRKLCFFAAHGIKQDFADMISNATTVDAVEVVRCKDCIRGYDDLGGIGGTYCGYLDYIVQPEFYCANGKRNEDK